MKVESDALLRKIKEFYPEIDRYSVQTSLGYDDLKNTWVLTMKKGDNRLDTHIEPKDAEECLSGVECVYLGHQVGQFIKVYCARGDACQS